MSVAAALRAALSDFYGQSLRLVVLNSALSAAALAIVLIALYLPAAAVLAVLIGPLAGALMHCTITLAQTDRITMRDALDGVRLHWRRGLALAASCLVVALVGVVALTFYAGRSVWTLPLAALVLYLLLVFGLLQLWLWPLAILEREQPFSRVLRDAGIALMRRPLASLGLATVLVLVNGLGAAAAILPLLTVTIAYSFVAVARFSLPPRPLGEE
jgi:hypothetical protein